MVIFLFCGLHLAFACEGDSCPLADQSSVTAPGEATEVSDGSRVGTVIDNSKTATADLSHMGLNKFSKFTHISKVFEVVMQFLGINIILASVIGGMIGGTMLIISAGNENLAERGKNILVASAIGLVITLLAYLGVTLVQQILYSI